jgi:hypothetical protein
MTKNDELKVASDDQVREYREQQKTFQQKVDLADAAAEMAFEIMMNEIDVYGLNVDSATVISAAALVAVTAELRAARIAARPRSLRR